MQKRLPALFAAVAGIGLAVLRAFFLVDAVEPDTGLIRRGDPLTFILAGAVILCGLLILWMALRYKQPKRAVSQNGNRLWAALGIVSGLFLAGFGGFQVFLAFDGEYFRLLIGGLAFLALASNLFTGRRIVQGNPVFSGTSGIWVSVPVFFFCSAMVLYFLEYAGQPAVSLYIYGALTIVFAALAQYRISGFCFRCGKDRSARFYTLTALFLSLLTMGGFLLASLLSAELHPYAQISMPNLLLFGFVLFHMSSAAVGLSSGLYDFGLPPEPKPKESELPKIETADEIMLDYLAGEDSDEMPEASRDTGTLEETEGSEEQ